jgi:GT2 family glycosyltransferase
VDIAVVVVTKNNVQTIGECLDSLMPYHDAGQITEIVVGDGGSTDGTLDLIKNYPVKLLFDGGRGFSGYFARDMAWRQTGAQLIVFLDSDAYVGQGFAPQITDFFRDEHVGIVGCWAKATPGTRIAEAVGQWWAYHGEQLRKTTHQDSASWFARLYRKVTLARSDQVPATGPCYAVRRKCLEAVDGFRRGRHLEGGDTGLSLRIMSAGWRSILWLDAPVYHHPPSTLRSLMRQRYRYGWEGVILAWQYHRGMRILKTVLAHLVAPALGPLLALRFKNPFHILLFPLANYVLIVGYLVGLLKRRSTLPLLIIPGAAPEEEGSTR